MDTKWLLATSLATLVVGNAYAGGGNAYLGADVGVAHSNATSGNLYANPDWCGAGTGYACTTDHTSHPWQLRAGYPITKRIAIEGSYTDLGNTLSATITNPTKPGFAGSAEQKTTAWTLAAVGKLPIAHSRWTAYGKAGITRWESKASYRNDSAYTGNTAATRHGVSPLVGLGAEYTLSDRWTARAGLERHFRTGERAQLLDWAAPQSLRTTNADATTFMLGVAYRF